MTFKNEDIRNGKTTKFNGTRKIYITTNEDDDGHIREVFVNFCASGTTTRGLCEALGRVISVALQHDHRLKEKISKTLEGIQSEIFFRNNVFGLASSIPDAISKVLKEDYTEYVVENDDNDYERKIYG